MVGVTVCYFAGAWAEADKPDKAMPCPYQGWEYQGWEMVKKRC